MQVRQLFDQTSATYTYLLISSETRQAVYIDTVFEQHQRDLALLNELQLDLVACLDTHCHADHVTGAWLMKEATGCILAASRASGISPLDRPLEDGDEIGFGNDCLLVMSTPGHTDGCVSYVSRDHSCVFTGDALLIRGCGRTDFQQGSASRLFYSIQHNLFSLPDHCIVYPAHDYTGCTVSTIGEEKRLNPRIGGRANESDFTGYMDNMHLPHPKKLDIAVPANLKAGKPEAGSQPEPVQWAPVTITYTGMQQIKADWVAEHLQDVTVLDVRPSTELQEDPESIPGSINIPIAELAGRISEIPEDKPVMAVCRSGRRSALACQMLKKAGHDRVANIEGGMLQWMVQGLPVAMNRSQD